MARAWCAVSTAVLIAVSACGDRPLKRGDSAGWTVTIFYTAVQAHHSGFPAKVTGCRSIDCEYGGDDLGTYPADFVAAVHDQGTGRTASGRYLNWSYDVGYWLDDAPRDGSGRRLRPFESAVADRDVLAAATRFTISDCGRADDGRTLPAEICAKLRAARWTVVDEFTPGLGGRRKTDVYIGEETGSDFTDGPWYTTFEEAALHVG
nr:hypothetical protein [Planosporangium mesophilum]